MATVIEVPSLIRKDWTIEELEHIHELPMTDLFFRAQTVMREYHDPTKIQTASLLSIKTGACPEDCGYCPQSAHHHTDLESEALVDLDTVKTAAQNAKDSGSTRLCMGAAWRKVRDGVEFDRVLEMVRAVRAEGLQACCTLGMLTAPQAERLAEAGLTAYNHNLDTGPQYYDKIITTRTFEDRLNTLRNVREAGIQICSGGILGMGESLQDRMEMLQVLASEDPHPESVPINALVPIEGTPLQDQPVIDAFQLSRMIATARIAMPQSMVRLSAGRAQMTDEAQALCFLAGANSIFSGDTLLTAPNAGDTRDGILFRKMGMKALRVAD
jgi:biotin synthase